MGKPLNQKRFSSSSFRNNRDIIAVGVFVAFGAAAFAGAVLSNDNDDVKFTPKIICGQDPEGTVIAYDLETGDLLKGQFISASNDDLPNPPIDSMGHCEVGGKIGHIVPLGNVDEYLQMHNDGLS